jgi:guanylate kinase
VTVPSDLPSRAQAAAQRRLTVLSGPSGVGKGSVIAVVRERHPRVWLSVSVTTRAPRPGEVDGVQYHFVDQAEFDRMAARGELLEHASYAGSSYGTPRRPVEERLGRACRRCSRSSCRAPARCAPRCPTRSWCSWHPPSFDELARRLTARHGGPRPVRARLDLARIEMAAEDEFDVVVVNDDLEAAADRLVALLQI